MTKELPSNWSKQDRLKGKRLKQAWEQFASESRQDGKPCLPGLSDLLEDQRLSAVLTRHEATLLGYPNVVGVAPGIRTRRGKPTGERCLVVYVHRKIPKPKLLASAVLPHEIDGVPIDVVEIGTVEPLSL